MCPMNAYPETTHARVHIISIYSVSLTLSFLSPVLSFWRTGGSFCCWFSEKQFSPSEGQRQVKFCLDDSKWSDYPNERQLSELHPFLCPSISLALLFFKFHPMHTLHHLRLFIMFTTWFHLQSIFPSLLIPHNVLLPSSSQPFIPFSLTFSFICLCSFTCQNSFYLLSSVFLFFCPFLFLPSSLFYFFIYTQGSH